MSPPTATAAWAGPDPDRTTTGLRRLLRTFRGHRLLTAWQPVTVELPCPQGDMDREPVHRDLYLATAHLTLADALVHLGHLLAESVIDKTLGPGDRLTLRSVPFRTSRPSPRRTPRCASTSTASDPTACAPTPL